MFNHDQEKYIPEMMKLVKRLGGQISGEHGIGLEKMKHVHKELDETNIKLMHDVKKQFDPMLILNPGKQDFLSKCL